jgi:hypothetical protein
MYSLISRLGILGTVRNELLPFVASVVIAELFYKFHSFSLECLAFLATWYVLSALQKVFERGFSRMRGTKPDSRISTEGTEWPTSEPSTPLR